MDIPRVTLLNEPDDDWLVEFSRDPDELLLNASTLGLTGSDRRGTQEIIVSLGAILVQQLRAEPDADNDQLTIIPRALMAAVAKGGSIGDTEQGMMLGLALGRQFESARWGMQ